MNRCTRCHGFVPPNVRACPNCRARKALWMAPLAFVGAGLATVTLSACYGTVCATAGKYPDGGEDRNNCGFDCTQPLWDGGDRYQDPHWLSRCESFDCATVPPADAGAMGEAWNLNCGYSWHPDAGSADDAGTSGDGGTDAGN